MEKGKTIVLYILSVLCLFFAIAPLFWGIFTAVNLLWVAGGVFFALFAYFRARLPQKVKKGVEIVLLVVCILLLVLVGFMLHAAYGNAPPEENAPQTVIVLGCQINGDQPSVMLKRRLDAALVYLNEHPNSTVIVSGGQGDNEDYSEAYVMAQYLQNNGIDVARILLEDKSTNTKENLAFSAQIIEQQGLDTRVVVATDAFHQLRARWMGQNEGLTVYAVSSNAPLALQPLYYLREFLALFKALLLG